MMPGFLSDFFSSTLETMVWHLSSVREAIWISPSTSLAIAALWATTCATPPAPMIRMFFFTSHVTPISEVEPSYATLSKSGSHPRLRQAPRVVLKREPANEFHLSVQVTYRDRRHLDPVEPVLLDHGVAAGIEERDAVPGLELMSELELSKNVSGKTGFAADNIRVGPGIWGHAGVFVIRQ